MKYEIIYHPEPVALDPLNQRLLSTPTVGVKVTDEATGEQWGGWSRLPQPHSIDEVLAFLARIVDEMAWNLGPFSLAEHGGGKRVEPGDE